MTPKAAFAATPRARSSMCGASLPTPQRGRGPFQPIEACRGAALCRHQFFESKRALALYGKALAAIKMVVKRRLSCQAINKSFSTTAPRAKPWPATSSWCATDTPALQGWPGAGAPPLPQPGPLHARPHEREQELRRIAAAGRSDDWRHRGRGGESKHPKYAVGDKVVGMGGWQEYSVVDANAVARCARWTPPMCRCRTTWAPWACPA
jgi:hypothetical protein